MMKSIFTLAFIFTTVLHALSAQECGTDFEPMPKETERRALEYLAGRQDGEPHARGGTELPVRIHVIRTSSGSGGLSEADIEESLSLLNDAFWDAGIYFYPCGPVNYIDRTSYYNFEKSDYPQLANQYNEDDVINVYFPNNVIGNDGDNIAGFAQFPWMDYNLIVIDKDFAQTSTFPHEMGHFLGIFHTHETAYGVELVNGANCNDAGDYFCDTPADPNLSGLVNSSCNYTGNDTDPYGYYYDPDPTNIMSYSRKSCRTRFTYSQIDMMHYFVNESYYGLECDAASQEVDLTLSAPITVTPSTIECDEPFSVHTNIWNTGDNTFYGRFTAALFDDDDDFVDYVEILSEPDGLPANYHYTNGVTFEYDGPSLDPGYYSIGIFGLAEGTQDWVPAQDGDYYNFIEVYISCDGMTPAEDLQTGPASVTCYPNPARDIARWELANAGGANVQLEVFTADGRRQYTHRQSGNAKIQADVSNWQPGIYLYRVVADSFTASGRLQVQPNR